MLHLLLFFQSLNYQQAIDAQLYDNFPDAISKVYLEFFNTTLYSIEFNGNNLCVLVSSLHLNFYKLLKISLLKAFIMYNELVLVLVKNEETIVEKRVIYN